MLKVDQIQDPETLRRVANLLDQTVDRLQKQVRDLSFENARLRGEKFFQADFSFPPGALQKALGQAPEKSVKPRSQRPDQKGHGPQEQPNLPHVEQLHELPESDRECSACGGTVEPIVGQTEDSEEITVTERTYTLVLHRRQKYRCRCNACVRTADGPQKLIPGGRYSVEFAAHVAAQKYAFHLPLERQVEMMKHRGLEVTSQTLWDQIEAAARALKPTYEALWAWLLTQPVLHLDESRWPMHAWDTKKSNWTAWCGRSGRAMWIRIASSKSEAEGQRLLNGYAGTVVADGYQVYKNLARGPDGRNYHLAHCWAHVLRKFSETEPTEPRSRWILAKIGMLYKIDKRIALKADGNRERHLALRRRFLSPLIEGIRTWALAQGGLQRSSFGKALAYMLSHWEGLKRFLDDPLVPLDNNPAEQALRDLVVGRKNHYGSRSQRGAEVSAIFYSLIGTAKLCGVPPEDYLRRALVAALKQPGAVTFPF